MPSKRDSLFTSACCKPLPRGVRIQRHQFNLFFDKPPHWLHSWILINNARNAHKKAKITAPNQNHLLPGRNSEGCIYIMSWTVAARGLRVTRPELWGCLRLEDNKSWNWRFKFLFLILIIAQPKVIFTLFVWHFSTLLPHFLTSQLWGVLVPCTVTSIQV